MRRTSLLAILFLSLSCLSARAQMARLYSAAERLPGVTINAISQDTEGFIWISTESGLVRFDGNEFITFQSEIGNPQSLLSDRVTQVHQDMHGQLWVATASGLQRFCPEDRTFVTFPLEPEAGTHLRYHLTSLEEVAVSDDESLLYVAVSGNRYPFVINTRTLTLDLDRAQRLRELAPSRIRNFFKDSAGRLWLSGEGFGTVIVDGNTLLPEEGITFSPELEKQRESILILQMAEDPATGKTLLCTADHGLLIYESDSGVVRRTKGEPAVRIHPNTAILLQDHFLIGTEGRGLKTLDTRTEMLSDATFPNLPYNTSSWKIHSLAEDNQGNLWIGAYLTGVLVIPKQAYGFEYKRFSMTGADGDISGCVSCTVKGPDGTLWVGTDGSGLFRVSPDGKTERLFAGNSGLGNNSVLSLCFDKRGTLWVGTSGKGLLSYTQNGGFSSFRDAGNYPPKRANFLQYDEKRDLLYVGTHGAGLVVIDARNEKVLQVLSNGNIRYVSALHFDRNSDRLWVGGSYVLFRYNPDRQELSPLVATNDVMAERVNCLGRWGQELWVGTGKGLVRYHLDTQETKEYTVNEGLSSNLIQGILLCENGDAWVSTSGGLNLIERQNGQIHRFYAYDGLQSDQFYRGAAYQDADGKAYFGGVGGLSTFFPATFSCRNHPMPPLSLSRFSIMNEPVDFVPDNAGRKPFTVPSDGHYFSIGFSVLEYTNPKKVRYQYRMDGFDNNWREDDGNSRSAVYTNLPPGRYTFRVKASFDGEPDNFSVSELPVVVGYPWYLRWWAFLCYGILAFGATTLLLHQYRQQKEHAIQELQLKTVSNLAHEIRTPIGLISSPLKKIRDQEPLEERRETYNLILQNCQRVNSIINQLVDVRRLDEGKIRFLFSEVDLVPLVQNAIQSFSIQAREKNVTVRFLHHDRSVPLWIDAAHFDKIIYNLLSNAFKFTPENGRVTVSLGETEQNHGRLSGAIQEIRTLSVFNSGSSVSRKDLPRIFDRYFQAGNAQGGSGVGLHFCKALVEAHKGKLSAENVPDGMLFQVILPCGDAHIPPELRKGSSSGFRPIPAVSDNSQTAGDRKRIVVVDDDEQICRYVESELSQKYDVHSFLHAEPAWKYILKAVPDIVVTDMLMPGLSGEELCRRIKENPETRFTSVIVLSGCADEDVQAAANKSGAARYLTKPLSMELLESGIEQLLAEKDAYRKADNEVVFDFSSVRVRSASDHLAATVLDTLRKNFENSDYTVDQLSRDVGISRVHLNRRLQELMHTSPSQLLREIRLRQAAYLLCNNRISVSEAAYKVGFSSQTYFSTCFRNRFGMTPSEFVTCYADAEPATRLGELFKFPLEP